MGCPRMAREFCKAAYRIRGFKARFQIPFFGRGKGVNVGILWGLGGLLGTATPLCLRPAACDKS